MNIHLYHHFDFEAAVTAKFDQILSRLDALQVQETQMKADIQARFDTMAATIGDLTTVIGSAESLLDGLVAEVAGLKSPNTDPETLAKIDELTATITARKAELAAKVVADSSAA